MASGRSSQAGFQKDAGFAYVILFCCFMLRVLEVYMPITFGIYVLEFMEYFHTDNTFSITFLGGLYPLSQACTGPIHGYFVKRFGARPVVMVGAVLFAASSLIAANFPSIAVLTVHFTVAGCCSMALIVPGQIIVQQYFDKKRSLAAGIWMSGASWGFFIWPPVARYLNSEYTWRGSYFINAGIVLNCVVFATLLRPPPKTNLQLASKIVDGECKKSKKCELKFLNWFLFLFGMSLLGTGQFVGAVYFPVKAHHEGVDHMYIPFLVSAMGVTGIILRPFSGFLGDLKCTNRQMLSAVTLGLSGISYVASAKVFGFSPLMAMAIVAGILQSLYCATTGAQIVDVFTLSNIEIGAGLFSMFFGIGLCLTNPVAGLLIDFTRTTDTVFYVFGGAHIIGGIIFAIVSRLTKHMNKMPPLSDIEVTLSKLRPATSTLSIS